MSKPIPSNDSEREVDLTDEEIREELTKRIKGPYACIKSPLTICDSRNHKLPPMK